MFAVRLSMAHGKGNVFVVRLGLAHGKGNEQGNRGQRLVGKKCLSCVRGKTHGKLFVFRAKNAQQTIFLPNVFAGHAPGKMRTAKIGTHGKH
jgi:hypothetical protein